MRSADDAGAPRYVGEMVGAAGIEPATPTMSKQLGPKKPHRIARSFAHLRSCTYGAIELERPRGTARTAGSKLAELRVVFAISLECVATRAPWNSWNRSSAYSRPRSSLRLGRAPRSLRSCGKPTTPSPTTRELPFPDGYNSSTTELKSQIGREASRLFSIGFLASDISRGGASCGRASHR